MHPSSLMPPRSATDMSPLQTYYSKYHCRKDNCVHAGTDLKFPVGGAPITSTNDRWFLGVFLTSQIEIEIPISDRDKEYSRYVN